MAGKATKASGTRGPGANSDPYSSLRSLFVQGHRDSLWFVTLVAVASLVWGLALGTLFVSRVVPLFAGWSVTAVSGASMGPTINIGDLIAFGDIEPEDIEPGRIIVFDNPAREGETTVHRVESINEHGEFITKGDANPSADSTPVPPEAVRGVATMLAPFAGYPTVWINNRDFVPLLILLTTLVAATAASLPPGSQMPSWPRLTAATRHPPQLKLIRGFAGDEESTLPHAA